MAKIGCPQSSCRAENEASANECILCGTPLQSYVRLRSHSAHLFNEGLASARNGEFEQARDRFASVVYWNPNDVEARNALAMACLELDNLKEAKRQWEIILERAPTDTQASAYLLARRGLSQIELLRQPAVLPPSMQPQPAFEASRKRRGRKNVPTKKKTRS